MKYYTITTTTNVTAYTFDELSEDAKNNVRQYYLDGQMPEIFTEDVQYDLEQLFPNSDLKVEYSLSYSQGDGFNIYGEISLTDLWDQLDKSAFTEKEVKFINYVMKYYGQSIKMPRNNGYYAYCNSSDWDFIYAITYDMEYDYIRNIKYDVLEKFNDACIEHMENLCGQYEKWGYSFFYEIDDDDLKDWCERNGYEFDENGEIIDY